MDVVITGARRGIGAGLADLYHKRGDTVFATSRGGRGIGALDVADSHDQARFAQELDGRAIDLLVCNAGIYADKGQAIDGGYDAQMWADTFATNVTGVFLTVQALLPNLRKAQSAKIAIISSQMASSTHAPGGSYIYRASKAAALNLGRNLASDLKRDGIAVGIYHPGWVKTDMGGESADITIEASVAGLAARFDALGLENTGCFETWDGRAHDY